MSRHRVVRSLNAAGNLLYALTLYANLINSPSDILAETENYDYDYDDYDDGNYKFLS